MSREEMPRAVVWAWRTVIVIYLILVLMAAIFGSTRFTETLGWINAAMWSWSSYYHRRR